MTRKNLYKWTLIVVLIYFLAIIIGIFLRISFPDTNGVASIAYQTFKDLVPFFIAIPAAWLGYCFQKRFSYLSALREFWNILIPACQQAIQYTHIQNPTDHDFAKTQQDLSTVIDSLRGVFKNLGPSSKIGLYPYENLKDICQIVSWLKFSSNHTDDDRYWARRCIRTLWSSMHHMLLLEFDREVPVYPLSKYLDDGKSLADYLKIVGRKSDGKLDNHELEQLIVHEEEKQIERLRSISRRWKTGKPRKRSILEWRR